ncbi:MAG: fibronectin type III domain-containing protein [Caldilineaceae bacterium]|nr:fibronectin type III domain-containing protein [Caldilineaceae bacterium]
MRLHTKPGLIVAAVAALFLLTALIWSLGADSATANSCSGGYHFHEPDTCHKHCKNGMSAHNSTHGDNCAVSNPTPKPTRRRSSPPPTPTPRPTPLPCPVAVQGFQVASGADSITDSSIKVTWDAPGPSSLYGYRIESCSSANADCLGATEVATPSRSVTSHTLTGLDPYTPYYLRITALAYPSSATCSDTAASAIVTATTAKIRLVVDNFRVAGITSNTVTLQWDAPVEPTTTGLDKYKIESCSSADASCPDATEVATPAKTATTQIVTGLDPSTTYYYRITALALPNSAYLDSVPGDTSGDTTGGNSGGNSGNPPNDENPPDDIVVVTTALPPVAGLAVTCTDSVATLTWTAPVSTTNVDNLEVQYCTDAACTTPVSAGTPLASDTSWAVVGLSANTNYYFRIRAAGKTGHHDSDWSDAVLCKTDKTPLPAITGFTVSSHTDQGGVPLTWNAMTHAALDKYRFEVCSDAQCSSPTGYDVTNAAYTHTCPRGDTCYYRVRAKATASSDYKDGPWTDFVIVSIPGN